MSKSVARSLTVVLCLIAVYVADLVATHVVFTSRFPGANDFYSRWGDVARPLAALFPLALWSALVWQDYCRHRMAAAIKATETQS